jgi:antibiotic biosynthesis monooxygenase (ABM) superfamily enzyme
MAPNETVIRAGDDTATLINVFDVNPSNQRELLDVLTEGTEQVMRHRPGFISVNLLASNDGTRVVNYAQWRSLDDLKAALADPDGRALVERASAIADAAPHVYSVVSVHHA